MQKQNKDFTKKSIEVDSRALKIQSQQAIRSVIDALVELITNSDDAYGSNSGKIIIEIKRQRDVIVGQVIVKDRAGGLTLNEMELKILKYGGFSAADKSRGFMGRGAKDIVALGDAAFESIISGAYHKVEITKDFETKIYKSKTPSSEDYNRLGVKAGKGGLCVTLNVLRGTKVPLHDTLSKSLQNHYALRDVLSRREVRLIDINSGAQDVIRYTPPEGTQVCDEHTTINGVYGNAIARLLLFLAPKELPSESNEGIIVCDKQAIHQVTRFSSDLDQDPIARRFFGRLECDYIRTLQLEFEKIRREGNVLNFTLSRIFIFT